MTSVICKRCAAADYVKNGIVRSLQRYRCRKCGCNFTATPPRGKHPAMKALTLLLYAMGNMSYRMIGRLLDTSHVSIYDWIRAEAEKLPVPEVPANVEVVILDEMWHFLQKKRRNSGFGERLILSSGELSPGLWVAVMMQPADASLIPSAWRAKHSSPMTGKASTGSSRKSNSSRVNT
jgi:transposase-like protein